MQINTNTNKIRGNAGENPKIQKVEVVSDVPRKVGGANGGGYGNKNQIPLNSRALTFQKNEIVNQDVFKGIKKMAECYLGFANQLLRAGEKIPFSTEDSVETLIWKSAEGVSKLQKANLIKKFIGLILANPLQFGEVTKQEAESYANSRVCWMTLKWIFEQHFEYDSERNQFADSLFEKKSDIMVEDIVPLLDQLIIELETMKEKYFFEKFRILMDPNLSRVLKYELVADFFGRPCLKNINENHAEALLSEIILMPMGNMAAIFSKTQILLDCFNKLKQVPKTYSNMKKGYDVLQGCSVFHKQNLPFFIKEWPFKKASPVSSGAYYSNYADMCSNLEKTAEKFLGMLEAAYAKKANSLFDEPVQTSVNKKRRNQKQRKRQQKNQALEIKRTEPLVECLETAKSKDSQQAINKPLTEIVEPEAIGEKPNLMNGKEIKTPIEIEEIVPTEPKELSRRKVIDLEKPCKAVYVEEEDEGLIEIETNSLMEVMRQLCEQDRRQKIIDMQKKSLRNAEAKKAALLIEEKPEKIIEKKIEVKKLNKTQKATLSAVLSQNPPHLKITGKEVESLIKGLGGTTVGAGGSMFHIRFAGTGEGKDGEYEVHHDGDGDKCLTSKWAKRAGAAIKRAIDSGRVVVEFDSSEGSDELSQK